MSVNPPIPILDKRALVARAQSTLGMTHEAFGAAIGVSKRTSARIAARGSGLIPDQYVTLAKLVLPRDPALAASLASAAGGTLESLGIVPSRRVPTSHMVDAVVCVAADALQAPPSAVRAALYAAFRRAREMHLAIEDVEATLAPRPPTPPPPPTSPTSGAEKRKA